MLTTVAVLQWLQGNRSSGENGLIFLYYVLLMNPILVLSTVGFIPEKNTCRAFIFSNFHKNCSDVKISLCVNKD